jgi:acyl transferase domain-containing protein
LSLAGSEQTRYEVRLRSDQPAYLQDHRVSGRVVLPGTAYIEMALHSGSDQLGPALAIEAMAFERPLLLAEGTPCTLQTVLTPEGNQRFAFAIYARPEEDPSASSWVRHAFGAIAPAAQRDASVPALDALRRDCCRPLRLDAFYRELGARGLEFGEAFRGIESLSKGPAGALGHIRLAPDCAADSTPYSMHPALLDACSQVVAAALTPAAGLSDLYMLGGLDRLICHEPT